MRKWAKFRARRGGLAPYILSIFIPLLGLSASAPGGDLLNEGSLATQYFGTDASWYQGNIPFLETSDSHIQDVYYYRWNVVNEHRLWLPDKQHWVYTEFYHPVSWESPDRTIDAAAALHINEGRWLRDHTYTDSYVDYWMKGYGNQYQYTFWAADAAYQNFLATGNKQTVTPNLASLKTNFQNWTNIRYDAGKQLFWQTPLQDATEWSVSASQVNDGQGGDAYRPTINSYMYANAIAISRIAQLAGDTATAADFAARASALKQKVQQELWNPQVNSFEDRFTARYPNLNYQFIDSPELAGMIPWNFELPDDTATYATAWNRVLSTSGFNGPYGLRTVAPDSPHYMNPAPQAPGSDFNSWNGPSWPYYTSMVLGGLANVLNDYSQHSLTRADYLSLLRQYTLQQYKNGQPYIAEEFQPDQNYWLVDVPNRSEDYFHSTYNDLIITGLAGLRPRADDVIEVNPLIDDSLAYLCLQNVPYHGLPITILWDRDNRYGLGSGLRILANGHVLASSQTIERLVVDFPIAGDANVDGIVNAADLGALAMHWQGHADWLGGDFNHDGFVDITDLYLLASDWHAGTAVGGSPLDSLLVSFGLPSVPEPAVFVWLLPAGLGLARVRRSR
jgi:hypothetical protein